MNFKVFKTTYDILKQHAHKSGYVFTPPTDHIAFNRMLMRAIRTDNVNTFVVNAFNTLGFKTLYYNFYESFHGLRDNSTLRESFFYVFNTICRHLSLLKRENALKLTNMICRQYFEQPDLHKFSDTCFLAHLVSNLPNELLEDMVISNFSNIIKDIRPEDVHYLATYSSWCNLISKNLDDVLKALSRDFNTLIVFSKTFPEYAIKTYEYIITSLAESKPENGLLAGNEHKLISDVLVPIADAEKYNGYYSEVLRAHVEAILENLTTFDSFYEVADFLVENFGISSEKVKKIINKRSDEVLSMN